MADEKKTGLTLRAAFWAAKQSGRVTGTFPVATTGIRAAFLTGRADCLREALPQVLENLVAIDAAKAEIKEISNLLEALKK